MAAFRRARARRNVRGCAQASRPRPQAAPLASRRHHGGRMTLHPLLLALGLAASTATVPYPDGYRDWHHVSTTVIQPGHPFYAVLGGINHTYANPLALEGYRSGTFPDGAMLVYDTLEARDADHALTEGSRK